MILLTQPVSPLTWEFYYIKTDPSGMINHPIWGKHWRQVASLTQQCQHWGSPLSKSLFRPPYPEYSMAESTDSPKQVLWVFIISSTWDCLLHKQLSWSMCTMSHITIVRVGVHRKCRWWASIQSLEVRTDLIHSHFNNFQGFCICTNYQRHHSTFSYNYSVCTVHSNRVKERPQATWRFKALSFCILIKNTI